MIEAMRYNTYNVMYARAHANSDDFEYVYNVNNDFGAIVVVPAMYYAQ